MPVLRSSYAAASEGKPGISPSRGEIRCRVGLRHSPTLANLPRAAERAPPEKLPISPQEGEMSGRIEGGAVPPAYQCYQGIKG
ncbi:hypothetical protein FJ980_22440 [Mesorhizobium sp. B1-1-5]|nr:hypothetical protein FJ980_22440 [Mesorhizobium sp. B1-1-5]